jgi:hypothetical protein
MAAQGLHWGSPVLESGITLIHDGELYYRRRDALKLAQEKALEEVAGLLWAAESGKWAGLFEQPRVLPASEFMPLRAPDPVCPGTNRWLDRPCYRAICFGRFDPSTRALYGTAAGHLAVRGPHFRADMLGSRKCATVHRKRRFGPRSSFGLQRTGAAFRAGSRPGASQTVFEISVGSKAATRRRTPQKFLPAVGQLLAPRADLLDPFRVR